MTAPGYLAVKRPSAALDFHVEPFGKCAAEALAFRNVNRAIEREQRYFDWRYHRPCPREPLIVWARTPGGDAVGSASLVPHDYFISDTVQPLGLLGDISVLPSYRGQGVARRMLAFLAQHEALRALRACVVLPNDEVTGALRHAGWREVTTIRRFVAVLDTRPIFDRRLQSGALARLAAKGANALLRAAFARSRVDNSTAAVGAGAAFDERHTVLWRAVASSGRVVAVRDCAYLTWRFVQHPVVAHRTFELCDGGRLAGYIVFHLEGDLVVVDDYLALDCAVAMRLHTAFRRWLSDAGLGTKLQVRTNCDGFLALPWWRLGLIRRSDLQRVMILDPHARDASPIHAAGRWHITPSDKDV